MTQELATTIHIDEGSAAFVRFNELGINLGPRLPYPNQTGFYYEVKIDEIRKITSQASDSSNKGL